MSHQTEKHPVNLNPLEDLEHWDEFLQAKYPLQNAENTLIGSSTDKTKEEFRNYEAEARPSVKEFYRLNHHYQTRDFVRFKKADFLQLNRKEMGIWEAMEYLNTLVDDSDPDTDLSQLEHLLQTAEAIRRDGHPRWLILTGLIHDLGKILCLFGEPQWAVVGDTFPVGCAYSENIVFSEFFKLNPDSFIHSYQTKLGVYEEGTGMDSVDLSWGHDEYLYNVVKEYLPDEALYPIRYHSFYVGHKEGEYDYLMNDYDREMFHWVRTFNPYDLYSKSDEAPQAEELRPFYEELIRDYFPEKLRW
jgi:inositol oxygenase